MATQIPGGRMNKRRKLVIVLGAAASLPQSVFAQAKKPPIVIGFLHSATPSERTVGAFKEGMAAHGWRDGVTYVLAMPGQFYRSADGLGAFEAGPLLFNSNMRHSALLRRGDELLVFWTQVGDSPERILVSRIDISGPWEGWRDGPAQEVLRPEHDWEGADAPLRPSQRSVAYGHVNQLRDPAIFEEGGRTYLLYAVAGESGIAIAEVSFVDPAITLPR